MDRTLPLRTPPSSGGGDALKASGSHKTIVILSVAVLLSYLAGWMMGGTVATVGKPPAAASTDAVIAALTQFRLQAQVDGAKAGMQAEVLAELREVRKGVDGLKQECSGALRPLLAAAGAAAAAVPTAGGPASASAAAATPELAAWQQESVKKLNAWRTAILDQAIKASAIKVATADAWHFWDHYNPVITCPPGRQLIRYGAQRANVDGGKWLCQLQPAAASADGAAAPKPCVIYSCGSNGDFQFETAMLDATSCDVVTLDCTYAGRTVHATRHTYKKWCLGDAPPGHNDTSRIYKRLPDIARELGHDSIQILKVDIEGFEFETLATLRTMDSSSLPEQIAVEIHRAVEMIPIHNSSAYIVPLLFSHLGDLGYSVVSREDNHYGGVPFKGCCSEFTLFHVPR